MTQVGRPRYREYYCENCGEEIPRPRAYRSKVCEKCGQARFAEATRQMIAKEGPIYEKWLANWKAAMKRYLEGQDGG